MMSIAEIVFVAIATYAAIELLAKAFRVQGFASMIAEAFRTRRNRE